MTQLTSFVLDVRKLSQSEIETKYGSYFLTHYIEDDEMDDSWSFQTNSVSNTTVSKIRDLVESGIRLNADAHRFVAFPVQKNPKVQNPWTDRISVGRARNNDIFIRDSSVSKLHCYFTTMNRELTLHDAGSRNGTMVNSENTGQDGRRPRLQIDEAVHASERNILGQPPTASRVKWVL